VALVMAGALGTPAATPSTAVAAPSTAATLAAGACGPTAMSAAQLNTVFSSPGIGAGAGVVGVAGADYQHVYPLPDGRFLWLFQDVFFSNDDDLRDSLGAAAHNAGLVQDGSCWTVLGGPGMQNYIGSSLTTPLRRWFWPMGGEMGSDGALWVFMAEMFNPRNTGAAYGAAPVATWVARINPSTLAVLSFAKAPDASSRLYGWSVVSDDTHSYLYGHCYRQFINNVNSVAQFDAGCMPHTYLARVPKGRFDLAPEYWNGGSWGGAAAARPLMTRGAANPMDVRRFGEVYVNVTKIDDWWGAWVYIDKAPNPWGPWENDQSRFIVAERKCSVCGIYHAQILPTLVDGALVVSWSNGGPFNLWQADADLYRPSFVSMPLPTYRTDPPAPGLTMTSRDPVRAIDTRSPAKRMRGGSMLTVALAGKVAPTAVGAVVNLTAVNPAGIGYLTAWPCGARMPLASVLNTVAGQNTANGAHVRLDHQQRLCVYASIDTDVVVDVTGSYVSTGGAGLHVLNPTRLSGDGLPVGAQATAAVPVADLHDEVPANASAVTVTVSVAQPTAKGYLTVWPCGTTMPVASTLNFHAGSPVANSATVPLGGSGDLCVFSSVAATVTVDLVGWWSASGAPARLELSRRVIDTRDGARPVAGEVVDVPLGDAVQPGAQAVVANITVVRPTGTGDVLAWACDGEPEALTLVAANNVNRAGVGLTALADDNSLCVRSNVAAHVVVDVMVSF